MLARSGRVANLRREVPFALAPRVRIDGRWRPSLRYIADFVYVNVESGAIVVEDCKGMRTPVYRVKRHLMKALFDIDILET